MKLKGEVFYRNGVWTFASTMYDGTPFYIETTDKDIQLMQELDAEYASKCVLHVVMEAQQDSRCYLTLPQPSLRHGKQIIVNRGQLVLPNTPIEIEESAR